MEEKEKYTVALAGNPNVGKSTVFNALTGLHQHTGNWPGKTVTRAVGFFDADGLSVELVDVPGTYSLSARSPDERVAAEYICGEVAGLAPPDGVIAVCDACCLERSLALVLQIIAIADRTVICLNLTDEAERRGIIVDHGELERCLGVPVIPCAARQGVGLDILRRRLAEALRGDGNVPEGRVGPSEDGLSDPARYARELVEQCVTVSGDTTLKDRRLDRIFTGRYTALPVSALLCALVFFITLKGASPLSDGLAFLLGRVEGAVRWLLWRISFPNVLTSALCDGVLRVLFWVVSVMTPPMAIFFPLFTLIEDFGYLPRVAYNFDRCFKCCGACGKQALTMMMGLGCNAAGVTGCRIIDSPRERLIAILTNSFMPCNGRFPVLAVFIGALGAVAGVGTWPLLQALGVFLAVATGVALTLVISRLLSATLLRGEVSSFTLELPPYRVPKASDVIVRSVLDRTLFVLGRAAAVAAPAGLVIWVLGNVYVGGGSLLGHFTDLLDPIGRAAGMDGVMLGAFILALPAGEITVPLMIMGYASGGVLSPVQGGTELTGIFARAGWTPVTAVCAAIFTLVHWPCSTTVVTVYRETGRFRWAAASVVIPTAVGYLICVAVNLIFS